LNERNAVLRFSALAVACVVALGFVFHASAGGTDTGAVTGTVTKEGKPIIGAKVKLSSAQRRKDKKFAPATNPSESGAKAPKAQPIASVTTDADGKFVIPDLAPGEYVVVVNEKGVGRAKAKVSVAASQSSDVAISLQEDTKPKDGKSKKNKLGL
jgi:hypothetical protein